MQTQGRSSRVYNQSTKSKYCHYIFAQTVIKLRRVRLDETIRHRRRDLGKHLAFEIDATSHTTATYVFSL